MFINEVDNDQATQAVDIALTYIKKNPNLGLSVQVLSVEGNRTDSKKFLENSNYSELCQKRNLLGNPLYHLVVINPLRSASETL